MLPKNIPLFKIFCYNFYRSSFIIKIKTMAAKKKAKKKATKKKK